MKNSENKVLLSYQGPWSRENKVTRIISVLQYHTNWPLTWAGWRRCPHTLSSCQAARPQTSPSRGRYPYPWGVGGAGGRGRRRSPAVAPAGRGTVGCGGAMSSTESLRRYEDIAGTRHDWVSSSGMTSGSSDFSDGNAKLGDSKSFGISPLGLM